MSKVHYAIDTEYNAEAWWDALYMLRDVIEELLNTSPNEELSIEASFAPTFEKVCETLPGWSDGPAHARHPLLRR